MISIHPGAEEPNSKLDDHIRGARIYTDCAAVYEFSAREAQLVETPDSGVIQSFTKLAKEATLAAEYFASQAHYLKNDVSLPYDYFTPIIEKHKRSLGEDLVATANRGEWDLLTKILDGCLEYKEIQTWIVTRTR